MILAAGEGTRFGQMTKAVPKALLPCLEKTLIAQLVESFLEAGIDKVTIGIGWMGKRVRDHVESLFSLDQVRCIDVPSYEIGPLQTLVTAAQSIDDTMLICPVDFFVEPSIISQMLDTIKHGISSDVCMATDSTPSMGTSVTIDEKQRITKIGEGSASSAMLLLAKPDFLDFCKRALLEGATKVAQVIGFLINHEGLVIARAIHGYWADIDTPSDLMSLNMHLLNRHQAESGSVYIPDGDQVEIGESLTLIPDIILGSGVYLIGPVLLSGKTSIASNCIVGPNVSIQGESAISASCKISDSLIFGRSTIKPGTHISRAIIHDSDFYMV